MLTVSTVSNSGPTASRHAVAQVAVACSNRSRSVTDAGTSPESLGMPGQPIGADSPTPRGSQETMSKDERSAVPNLVA